MGKATEAALRESWALYREHIGGPLTVSWDALPQQRREQWAIVTAPFREAAPARKPTAKDTDEAKA